MKKFIKAAFGALLSLLILESVFVIHEYGHLREFQKRGVPIEEFSLGVGPVVYHHRAASFVVNVRAIPIMAYVATTDEGGKRFDAQGSLRDKIVVDAAGVRNNFVAGLLVVLVLQALGWTKGNLSARELAKTIAVTPCKIVCRFFAFFIGCMTFGRVNLAERFLLSTGGIDPTTPLKQFVRWNLILGLFNVMPFPPLDGGHIAQAMLSSTGNHLPDIPSFLCIVLFVAFYMTANMQNIRVLEIELES